MADLTTVLNEGNASLDELKQAMVNSRARAGEACLALQTAGQRLVNQEQQLSARITTAQTRLHKEAEEVEADSQQLAGQLKATTSWAELRRDQLDKERQRVTQSLQGFKQELQQAEQQLEAHRHEAAAAMEAASQSLEKSLVDLAADLDQFSTWLNDTLVPTLNRERTEVEDHAEKLRYQVLHQIMPAILREYEALKAHLLHLNQEIATSLEGGAADSAGLAHQALAELARTLTTLCECNAEGMRGVILHLKAEENHLRARSDDLFKHARVYAELAEPAVDQLRKLVEVVFYMEELLIKNQVLAAPGGLL